MRQGFVSDSFARQNNLTFGAGANETPLQQETEAGFADLMQRLFVTAIREAVRAIRSFVCSRRRGFNPNAGRRPYPD